MNYLGEFVSLGVSMFWTVASLASEVASRRLGVVVLNVWRMLLTLTFSVALLWIVLGTPLPIYAGSEAWKWLLMSGVVGYFFGDWFLFNSYVIIGSRFGQLIMTLSPAFTALAAWIMLGQQLSLMSLIAMTITLGGIAISIIGPGDDGHKMRLRLPLKGVVFGIMASIGQGVGLVLSKIGLDHYIAGVPAHLLPETEVWLPFSSNMIRCVAGLLCFSTWLWISNLRKPAGKRRTLLASTSNRTGMMAMILAVITGPFLGVGLSLMAVQYTAAGIASTIMATTPILILLPSRWLFGQKITLAMVIGAIVSVVGVSLFFV